MCRMNNDNLDETRPASVGDETMPVHTDGETAPQHVDEDRKSQSTDEAVDVTPEPELEGNVPGWRWLILLSLAALMVIAVASVIGGYRSGINQRTSFEATQVSQTIGEQFNQGLLDMQEGRYEIARQRFEYVIRLNPNYPGVTNRLAEVLLEINTTATPTTVPTPTLTPTVDLRGAEELFSQAQVLLADHNWTEAIETLLKLRKDEPDYHTVEVDSMLYVGLRNRGVDKILNQADLEGGTYDLALAERFGPLDIEAKNYRDWADLYAKGVSFWELDWSQAVFYFGQLIVPAPNLRDSAGMTATERYRQALIRYGDQLADSNEFCLAQEQYEAAFNVASDPQVEPTASWVTRRCENEQEDAEGGDEGEEEPTQPPVEVTATPGGEASPTPGAQATATPGAEATPTPEQQVTLTPEQQATATPEPTQEASPEPTAGP
jgi:tetratricopeptide (TPR) repeat protein